MSRVYLGSDWHLGHKNIAKYGQRTHIETIDDNYSWIADNYQLTNRDTLFLLGDIVFEERALFFLQSLPGQKYLIGGNHDFERGPHVDMYEVARTFDGVWGMRSYGNSKNDTKCWLTHCPIHESEMRRKNYNVHGHIHNEETNHIIRADKRYVNVNVDVMWPKEQQVCMNFQELMEKVKKGDY